MIFLVQFGINRSFNNLGGEGEKKLKIQGLQMSE